MCLRTFDLSKARVRSKMSYTGPVDKKVRLSWQRSKGTVVLDKQKKVDGSDDKKSEQVLRRSVSTTGLGRASTKTFIQKKNLVSVQVNKYLMGIYESTILPTQLIVVLSVTPEISTFIENGPENIFFKGFRTRWMKRPKRRTIISWSREKIGVRYSLESIRGLKMMERRLL